MDEISKTPDAAKYCYYGTLMARGESDASAYDKAMLESFKEMEEDINW